MLTLWIGLTFVFTAGNLADAQHPNAPTHYRAAMVMGFDQGVSTDTLRHYERIGLLPRTSRTAAGYRRYPPETVERVHLIQRALAVGFSLKELTSVLVQRDRGEAPCRRVRALVGERLEALDNRPRDLQSLRDEMRIVLREWDQRLAETPNGQRARLLDMLARRPGLEGRANRAPASAPTVRKRRSR